MRMTMFPILFLVATAAMAADPPTVPPELQGKLAFCKQPYALCIKAPCTPDPNGRDNVPCVCDVIDGWSMGPGTCDERAPKVENGRTHLISTYANLYNRTNLTLSCPSNTLWALCFGAKCVIDGKDSNKAVCSCPTVTSASMTLGGDCDTANCSKVWSAATPGQYHFANDYYFWYMTSHKLTPPALLPAKDCPPPPPPPTSTGTD
ncbi:MAG: hypothetical protein JWO56_2656 [Acidobacteria bacterium]|nr:hypothetical protein [Acidobacteriota bacterium]